jgi:hypothetical protein
VCGLYVDPPQNAIVVSVDEKTSIAAREPARPDTPPAPGRPARRDSEYLRNGTQNLFAALAVHSGEVSGMTAPTRNQFDFIAFLDQLEAEIPAHRQVIAVLDNLSTHKTQAVGAWLDAHPRWRFVFTPKHALLAQASSRGESHPPALSEPGVHLSAHRAPIIQPDVALGNPKRLAVRLRLAHRLLPRHHG